MQSSIQHHIRWYPPAVAGVKLGCPRPQRSCGAHVDTSKQATRTSNGCRVLNRREGSTAPYSPRREHGPHVSPLARLATALRGPRACWLLCCLRWPPFAWLSGTEIGWLFLFFDYRLLPIFGPLVLGALMTASPFLFWRALVAGQRQQAWASAGWVALAGLVLLVALGSYQLFFKLYSQYGSVSTSRAHYYLLSHTDAKQGLDIISFYACDRSGTFCHQVYTTSTDTSFSMCSGEGGGCFLEVEGEQVLVYVGGVLVYTAGP